MEGKNYELPNNDYDYKQEKINKEIHNDLEFSSKALQGFKYIFMGMLVVLMIGENIKKDSYAENVHRILDNNKHKEYKIDTIRNK